MSRSALMPALRSRPLGVGSQTYTRYSCSVSAYNVSTASCISIPTRRADAGTPFFTWPSTTMPSASSSTAASANGSNGSAATYGGGGA